MDKVFISTIQEKVLLKLKKEFSNEDILIQHSELFVCGDLWAMGYESLNSISLEDMAIILLIGYEIKKTPEEKIVDLFNNKVIATGDYSQGYHDGKNCAIISVLDILNMKIDGIN